MTEIQPVRVERGDKIYVFDPEKITNGQYEAIEKELMVAGIDTRMSDLILLLSGKEYQLPPATDKERDIFMNRKFALDDTSELAIRARDYKIAYAKKGTEIMRAYRDAHELLLKAGSRPKLVAMMLVPEGQPYTEATYREVLTDVVPRLTRGEVDTVLSNFLPSRIWSLNNFPRYLNTGLSDDQSQEKK